MCYSALVKQDLKSLEVNFGAIAVRSQIDDFLKRSERDPKHYPKPAERIFPGGTAPIIFERDGKRVVEYMRYGSYPPKDISNAERYTNYNARRDNLYSHFWSNAFMRHHGFIVVDAFYEWVEVRDLLKAKVVSIDDVEERFRILAHERKIKIEAAGKTYKQTPTEKKKPLERKIIIEFSPEDPFPLMIPVIFSLDREGQVDSDKGFAIVTDDPPLDVSRAGHDRCPIVLNEHAVAQWLKPSGAKPEDMLKLLSNKTRPSFQHRLDDAI